MPLTTRRRTAVRAGAVSALLAGLVGLGAPSGAVTENQSYWTPVSHVLTVSGHGFGHGHGLSQYGAQGAALRGLTAAQIVAFYYPGTKPAAFTGPVRVLITRDTDSILTVAPRSGLRLRDLGTRATYALPATAGVTSWRLRVVSGKTVVEYLSATWHRWRPGGRANLAGDGELYATGPVTLRTGSGSAAYRGSLRLAGRASGSGRDVVNVLPMDSYVRGVIPREMPPSWAPTAVQAQAIAARTYAANAAASYPTRDWQICDTSSCQVYGGLAAEDPRANAAVTRTAGQILMYAGKPAFTQFSASNGGWTSAGSVPYLTAKADPYDAWSGNAVHSWSTTVDTRVLERRYPSLGDLQRIRVTSRDGHGDWGGRVGGVVLDGSKADVTITGDTFRSVYGLRSSWFTIAPTPIIARWNALGGATSNLGAVTGPEVAVKAGSMQTFAHGRIYLLPSVGARQLLGPTLAAYLARGGPTSFLGLPTGATRGEPGGTWAKFQHGEIHCSATGARIVRY